MPTERESNNLEEILSALRDERSEVREQAIYDLFTYANRPASEATIDWSSLDKGQTIEALNMARTRLLHDRRIVETLLLTIKDSSPYVRTWTALLLDTSTMAESQKTLIRYLHDDSEAGYPRDKQKPNRPIVSRWKYVGQVSKRIVLVSGGCVSAILALCLCLLTLMLLGLLLGPYANILVFIVFATMLVLAGGTIFLSK